MILHFLFQEPNILCNDRALCHCQWRIGHLQSLCSLLLYFYLFMVYSFVFVCGIYGDMLVCVFECMYMYVCVSAGRHMNTRPSMLCGRQSKMSSLPCQLSDILYCSLPSFYLEFDGLIQTGRSASLRDPPVFSPKRVGLTGMCICTQIFT